MNLNDKQLLAVNHQDGPCLVIAGAGSGKTRVLTQRIAHLIENGVYPSQILAITFTNKAAKEMKNRVENIMNSSMNGIFIGTFHSFGLKIIRENTQYLCLDKNITILDSNDSKSLVKRIMKELSIDTEYYDVKDFVNMISYAKNEGLSPEEYDTIYKYDDAPLKAKVYAKYIQTLKLNNTVDFDDLLLLPVKLFKNNKEVLEKYQDKYKYILVDEYQDTNQVQYELCKMLAKKYRNLFVVGDSDQSIYSWRKANYKNILNFEKDYKDAKTIVLEENYRSTKIILNAANSVIKHNTLRKEKNLFTSNELGKKITITTLLNEKFEASYITDKVKELLIEGYPLKEIAVFYRTNAQSRVIEEAFLKENIPYNVIGSYYFYNRKEIKDLISYLNLVYNTKDNVSLERIINEPKRGIGQKSIESIRELALEKGVSEFEVIDSGKELKFKELILSLQEDLKNMNLPDFIRTLLDKSGLLQSYDTDNLEDASKYENLQEFISIATTFNDKGIYSLEEFLENIMLVSDQGQYNNENNEDVVSLMTLHSSKGLEFDAVFLTGMEEGLFPHSRSYETNEEMEEERRLCYVGITRAKKQLYMTLTKSRMLFGRITQTIPSRFIEEVDKECVENNNQIKEEKIDNMYTSINSYKVGDHVKHDKFGYGIIVSIDKDLAKIAFKHPVGIKTMSLNHVGLKKC